MAEQNTNPPVPQDLDEFIFLWDRDLPTVSDR